MPTARIAAPAPSSAASAVRGPPQRVSVHVPAVARVRLNLRRSVADELSDIARSDDDRIDSRPLELENLIASLNLHFRNRKLSSGDIWEEVECTVDRVSVVIAGPPEQEDLRVKPRECELEL